MKCEDPVVGHYSSENENENENEICDIARMVEWLKTRRLSRRSPGSAGSNPAPRIFFLTFIVVVVRIWRSWKRAVLITQRSSVQSRIFAYICVCFFKSL